MMDWCCGAGAWWMLVVGSILVAAILVAVVVGVRAISKRGDGGRTGASTPDGDALRILEERYARGEIGIDEFEERRRVLLGAPVDGR
jgi:putative membrane protein